MKARLQILDIGLARQWRSYGCKVTGAEEKGVTERVKHVTLRPMKTITIRDLRQRWPESEKSLQIENEILHLAAMEELRQTRLTTFDQAQAEAAMALGHEVVRPGRV